MKARRTVVSGRVQGVGYRFFAERTARELGVHGWVRNLSDGRVEALAEGEEEAIVRFVERLREGPRGSRVESLLEEDVSVAGFSTFEITR